MVRCGEGEKCGLPFPSDVVRMVHFICPLYDYHKSTLLCIACMKQSIHLSHGPRYIFANEGRY